jgi:multidrug efflux system membrane fusion protein
VPNPFRVAGLILAGCVFLSFSACSSSSSAASGAAAGGGGRGGRGGGAGAVVPVVVGRVVQKDVPVDLTSIGNVEAFSVIGVRSQVTGALTEVTFQEGDVVKKGDVLFRIEPRAYQAALDQAAANLARDEALQSQAEAQLARDLATSSYTRTQTDRTLQLVERGIASKDEGEQAQSARQAAEATVTADRASIASAKAQLVAQQATVDSAKLQLEYTVIRSPIDGQTGDLGIKAGNLVTANSTVLVTITQVDPIYVTFTLPAVHLPAIKTHMATDKLAVSATPQSAGADPVNGSLSFVDNAIDPATDTIKLKATFANPQRALWPGQFARVSLRLTTLSNATVVPSQAIQTGQDGQFVFVVKGDSTVEQRPVTTGQAAGDDVVVANGLTPGESIVTEGQLRLEPGTRVTRADPRTGEAAPGGQGRGGRGGRGQGGAPGGGQGQGQGQGQGRSGGRTGGTPPGGRMP